jgi:hypothetical protein
LSRPASPLLHDYKPPASAQPAKSKALQWFAVGLSLPLVAVTLFSAISNSTAPKTEPATPVMTSSADEPLMIPLSSEIAGLAAEPIGLPDPTPVFDKLVLTIASGDTMEELFREHDLDLGHLVSIAKLKETNNRFRKIKPGDVFEITHDAGQLISMYAALNLTSALQIDKSDLGFTAQVVERTIDIRKRMAYGVIDTSLFESGAEAGLSDKVIMNMAGIFAWDVDFVLDIRQGDNYYVQYEEIWQDGEHVMDGEIIAAEFNNNGRTIQAIRFVDNDEHSEG